MENIDENLEKYQEKKGKSAENKGNSWGFSNIEGYLLHPRETT